MTNELKAGGGAGGSEPEQDEQLEGWTPKFTVWLVKLKDGWPYAVESVWLDETDAKTRAAVRGPAWEALKYSHLQPPQSVGAASRLPDPAVPSEPMTLGLKGDVDTWRDAALCIGEQLGANGPEGYYAFSPAEWFHWCLKQVEASRASGVSAPTPADLVDLVTRFQRVQQELDYLDPMKNGSVFDVKAAESAALLKQLREWRASGVSAEGALPKRNAKELAQALRTRASYLHGEPFEAPATAAMMCEAADMIEAGASGVSEAGGWRDIATAPKDGTRIVGFCPSQADRHAPFPSCERVIFFGRGAWLSLPGWWSSIPTHWMPLPAAPAVPDAAPQQGEDETTNDFSRQRAPDVRGATGSPRSPQPKGSER